MGVEMLGRSLVANISRMERNADPDSLILLCVPCAFDVEVMPLWLARFSFEKYLDFPDKNFIDCFPLIIEISRHVSQLPQAKSMTYQKFHRLSLLILLLFPIKQT